MIDAYDNTIEAALGRGLVGKSYGRLLPGRFFRQTDRPGPASGSRAKRVEAG